MIEEGFIDLPGLNYGFIGGATGMLSKRELLITGTLKEHPSQNKINEFSDKHKIKFHYISNNKIIDIGSIITF